ncbi:MAG: DUF6250 domain-containing protein [Myxococcaceae bacterium]
MGQPKKKDREVVEEPADGEAAPNAWSKPAGLTRRGWAVIGAIVFAVNLPIIHYYLLRPRPEAGVALPFRDTFSDPGTVAKNYWTAGGLWRAQNGELLAPGVKGNPLWLKARLPDDVVVEFDVRSASPEGDLKVELFGNGLDRNSGYTFILGGWNNSLAVIARLDENAPSMQRLREQAARVAAERRLPNAGLLETGVYRADTRARVELSFPAQMGRTYHWRIERRGSLIRWSIDGQPFMEFDDPLPLKGPDHDRFGFANWESQLYFDNLVIGAPGAVVAKVAAPAPVAPGPFADTFDRAELGEAWNATAPQAATLEGGALTLQLVHNRPLWLRKPIPADAAIEFDAWTDDPQGDLKVEVWGDGRSFYSGDLRLQYTATGYVFIFGGWRNTASIIARQTEHAKERIERTDFKVEPGKRYRWRIARKGGVIDWSVDGKPFLQLLDPSPLGGPANQYFGFSGWETRVHFDNLTIEPL